MQRTHALPDLIFFVLLQAEREREIKRRQMGKELVAAKEKFKEEQIQRDLALRKKEKQVRTLPSACDLCASP
jgi:hypothetical protein